MKDRLLNITLAILACTSLIVTALLVRREFFHAPEVEKNQVAMAPPGWRQYRGGGLQIGSRAAPVSIIVFSDFQCPFCKQFSGSWAQLYKKYPNDVRLIFHQFPLESIHPFAREAALLAECAGSRGRFPQMERVLFANQDSIGTASWAWFGKRAGISDSAWVQHCVADSVFVGRVQEDESLGRSVPIHGTPTVFVNKWIIRGSPPWFVLDSLTRLELTHTLR
jgi:protein-disulfide isomerase